MESTTKSTQASSTTHENPTETKVPDGRKNSVGEMLPSPVETWKPNFARRQSWKFEDLKREHVAADFTKSTNEKNEALGGFSEAK
ncbi:hypothetical protein D0Z07_4364 [Hyphodiscus hymeniophilus]|uniref:Uncharacterized protein n=1 Tax=Hyphodiscus hymeniophilus TaxID=353542 RepID=A0A9P7AXP1_9HELO|nr:hypothetical protein D0Z07_4364 [Hyphodiscus hymeniophilus]